jgi:hypothetical protein
METFKPGDQVPFEGPYWVSHRSHREPHLCKTRFKVFPSCVTCGDKVRFTIYEGRQLKAGWLREDRDFQHAVATENVPELAGSDPQHKIASQQAISRLPLHPKRFY